MNFLLSISLSISLVIISFCAVSAVSEYLRRISNLKKIEMLLHQMTEYEYEYENNEYIDSKDYKKRLYEKYNKNATKLNEILISDVDLNFKLEYILTQYQKIEKEIKKTSQGSS